MLCLTRTVNSSVIINHQILVTVVEIENNKVRLAFIAPDGIEINRLEIEEEKHGVPEQFREFLNDAKDSTGGKRRRKKKPEQREEG